MQHRNTQPSAAFLRIAQIIGNPDAVPPIPPLIPIGRSTWWLWVRTGKAPASVKLGKKTTAWRADHVQALIDSLGGADQGDRS